MAALGRWMRPAARAVVRTRVVTVSCRAATRALSVETSTPGVYRPDKLDEVDKAFLKQQAASASSFVPPTKGKGKAFTAAGECFRVASESGKVDAVVDDLLTLSEALGECSSLVLRPFQFSSYSPAENLALLNWLLGDGLPEYADIPADIANRLIESEENYHLFEAAEAACADVELSDETVGLLADLASQARLDLVAKASRDFLEMVKVSRNAVDVTVVSAVELTDAQRTRVEAALTKAGNGYVPEGKSASVGFDVDPAILGGLLVHVENSTLDVSAQSLIRDMNEEMAAAEA